MIVRSDVDRFGCVNCDLPMRVEAFLSTPNDQLIMEEMLICTICRSVLPIMCYSGPDTDWPITEAGIPTVFFRGRPALASALENVLSDTRLRSAPPVRSRNAQEKYFSWAAITEEFAATIRKTMAEDGKESSTKPIGAVRVA